MGDRVANASRRSLRASGSWHECHQGIGPSDLRSAARAATVAASVGPSQTFSQTSKKRAVCTPLLSDQSHSSRHPRRAGIDFPASSRRTSAARSRQARSFWSRNWRTLQTSNGVPGRRNVSALISAARLSVSKPSSPPPSRVRPSRSRSPTSRSNQTVGLV